MPHYIAICGILLYHIFPHYPINGTIFGKKNLLDMICVSYITQKFN